MTIEHPAHPRNTVKGDFAARAHDALANTRLRSNLASTMAGLIKKRRDQFAANNDFEILRAVGENARKRTLSRLPDLLEKLEANCQANGIVVHWAETVADGNRIVADILRAHDARTVVKGKSMVTEEMHLNDHLAGIGVEVLESDLGEYVIQLAGETPSHIIMPCIHKNKDEIAALFHEKIEGAPYTEDVEALTAIARDTLRDKFKNADAGMSGVNFAIAETGTLLLVENEGNGRMSTTSPPLHIAVTGIDKVLESLSDVPSLLKLLTRSATGQHITTYVNMISGARKADEKDGPREVHLVLLDNGRSRVYSDAALRPTLQCIRCGACMNHCPVYTRVGGHAYGAIYPGPIGKILTPQLEGVELFGDLPSASSLCNACVEVCPVGIPIAEVLVHMREAGVSCSRHPTVREAGAKHSTLESWVWKAWRQMHRCGAAYRVMSRLLVRVGPWLPACFPLLAKWTRVRSKPKFAPRTLHEIMKARENNND